MRASPLHPVAVVHWAVAFVTGMLAVPAPHHTWVWFCLGPYCWHFWCTLGLIQRIVQWHVYREVEVNGLDNSAD